jgi:hypothetical protein
MAARQEGVAGDPDLLRRSARNDKVNYLNTYIGKSSMTTFIKILNTRGGPDTPGNKAWCIQVSMGEKINNFF